jgi:hypothetical protein
MLFAGTCIKDYGDTIAQTRKHRGGVFQIDKTPAATAISPAVGRGDGGIGRPILAVYCKGGLSLYSLVFLGMCGFCVSSTADIYSS